MSEQPTAAHVRLAPLRGEDFAAWAARSVRGYAAQLVTAGVHREPNATDYALRQMSRLLPHGPVTPGHCLWSLYDGGGDRVGHAWLQLRHLATGVEGYLLDIDVELPQRRRGLGRGAVLAVEEDARRRGATAVRLSVFGHNTAARALYSGLGYTVVEATWTLVLPRRPVHQPPVGGAGTAPGTGGWADDPARLLQLQHRDDGVHALVSDLAVDEAGRSGGGRALLRGVQDVAVEMDVRTLTVVAAGPTTMTSELVDECGFTLVAQTMVKPLRPPATR